MVTTIISWNGTRCTDVGKYGVTVDGWPEFYIPERDISEETIPGRNSPFLIDDGTYQAYSQKYTLHWRAEDDAAVERWLFGTVGWCKLTDSYKPGYFREAYIVGGHSITNVLNVLHTAVVTFRCKPFWFKEHSKSTQFNFYEESWSFTWEPGFSGIVEGEFITIETDPASLMTKLVIWASDTTLYSDDLMLTITRDDNAEFYKAEIDCDALWVRLTTDAKGTVEYVHPAIKYGWPKFGQKKDAFYGKIGIKAISESKVTKTATVSWKECRLL